MKLSFHSFILQTKTIKSCYIDDNYITCYILNNDDEILCSNDIKVIKVIKVIKDIKVTKDTQENSEILLNKIRFGELILIKFQTS